MLNAGSAPQHLQRPIASVIIPAHNEASVIERCISTLLRDAAPGEFEVCVASNGSTDQTVALATAALSHATNSQVLESAVASKAAALRVGDENAKTFPRIYLDADITVSTDVAREVAKVLSESDSALIAAPAMVIHTEKSHWSVRSYHRVWEALPYVSAGIIGSGFYAVNAAGSKRIGRFPDLMNDDAFVRAKFAPAERINTFGEFHSIAPVTLAALIRRRARTDAGNRELNDETPNAASDTTFRSMLNVSKNANVSTLDIVVYVVITVAAKVLSRLRTLRGTERQWSMDTTSR